MIISALRNVKVIKQLLTTAEAEAARTDDEVPGPEHLVLAALALPDGTAAAALSALGADEAVLRAALTEARHQALLSVGVEPLTDSASVERGPAAGVYRSTAQAQQTFQQAARLSKSSRPRRLLGAHVVAAAVDESERGTLGRALRELGIAPSDLRAAALTAAGQQPTG